MGLALEVSHGRHCLPYEAEFRDADRKKIEKRKEEIGATVNAQSDDLRTLIILRIVKLACQAIGLNFHQSLEEVKRSNEGFNEDVIYEENDANFMDEEMPDNSDTKPPNHGPSTAAAAAAAAATDAEQAATAGSSLRRSSRQGPQIEARAAATTAAAAADSKSSQAPLTNDQIKIVERYCKYSKEISCRLAQLNILMISSAFRGFGAMSVWTSRL
jgi:hypothetical protein